MQIHFQPPSLAAALQAPALYRLLVEGRSMGMYGQFFVVKETDKDALNLRFQPVQGPAVSVTLDERLLWSSAFPAELREKAAELVHHAGAILPEFPDRLHGETARAPRNRPARNLAGQSRHRPAA
jgi:hypothetical protein